MATKDTPQPTWQPIARLPMIATHIDDMLESAEENYANLQEAKPKPHVLDDYTVGRVIKVFTTQRVNLDIKLLIFWQLACQCDPDEKYA